MKLNRNNTLLLIAFAFYSFASFSPAHEITIKFFGNCGLYMTDGNLDIYTDFPCKSGAYGYMEYNEAELDSIKGNSIFLFTHKRADHYLGKKVRQVLRAKKGKKFTPWRTSQLEKFSKTIPDFNVQVFRTKHRFSLKHNLYLITWRGKKIFLSGDTESAETIGKIEGIDWAFLPSWILIDAEEKNIKIDAKMRALYHIYPNEIIEGEIPARI